jgi:4-hydroxythreonine-4-phosphate dehydrogenase
MKPLLGVTMGDPAGIGPEVVLRAAATTDAALLLLGDPALLAQLAVTLTAHRPPVEVESAAAARQAQARGEAGPWVLRCTTVPEGLTLGQPRSSEGRAALDCIVRGAYLAQEGAIDALVTAPVNKELIARHEPRFMGHTEFLAERAGARDPIMLFAGIRPQVALLTTHLPTATALTLIRTDAVRSMLGRLSAAWEEAFGHPPVVGVAALNPHAGEGGHLGTEESRVLAPAIAQAREAGIDARGPYPADSIFLHQELDVLLALYHDQGTIIAKRAPEPSVNVTLGLPYLRTSPDHGTAYEIAAAGTADASHMIAAVELARELAARRTSAG